MTPTEIAIGAVLIGVLGIGGGKMWSNRGKLDKRTHDEFCALKLKPITDGLDRIEGKVDRLLKEDRDG